MSETWGDVVKEYFPEASEEEVEYILWEKTPYPMIGEAGVRSSLAELKQRLGVKESEE